MFRIGRFHVLLPSFRARKVDLIIALVAAFGAQAIGIPLPLLTRKIVNHVTDSTLDPASLTNTLWLFGIILLGLALVRGILRWQQSMRGERLAQGILADLRSRMYRHLQRLPQGYFDRKANGKVLIRFVGDANALRSWLAKTLITVPADILTLLGVYIAISTIKIELLPAAVIPLTPLVPILLWINPRASRWTRHSRNHQSRLCGLLGERIAAMNVVKAVNAQEADHADAREMIGQVADANTQRGRLDAWANSLTIVASTVSLGAVGVFGAWLCATGALSQGDLLAAVWLTILIRGPMTRLARANVIHQRAAIAVDRITALLERAEEPGWSENLSPYAGPGRTIELRQLGYQDSAGTWMWRNLSATIQGPGLFTVSGDVARAKSMLLETLLRVRRPHEGRIRMDEQDIRKLKVAELRRRVGWVDRDCKVAELVARKVQKESDNVTRNQIDQCWRSTEAIAPGATSADLVSLFDPSRQWDDVLRKTSGEIHLRLAVCCALANNPPILLLDDPTNTFNEDSTSHFLEWLEKEAKERFIVVATNDARIVQASKGRIDLSVVKDEQDPHVESGAPVITEHYHPHSVSAGSRRWDLESDTTNGVLKP